MLSFECDIMPDSHFFVHMTARMYQREAFIEEIHFRIGAFSEANVSGGNHPAEHMRKTVRGETK